MESWSRLSWQTVLKDDRVVSMDLEKLSSIKQLSERELSMKAVALVSFLHSPEGLLSLFLALQDMYESNVKTA